MYKTVHTSEMGNRSSAPESLLVDADPVLGLVMTHSDVIAITPETPASKTAVSALALGNSADVKRLPNTPAGAVAESLDELFVIDPRQYPDLTSLHMAACRFFKVDPLKYRITYKQADGTHIVLSSIVGARMFARINLTSLDDLAKQK